MTVTACNSRTSRSVSKILQGAASVALCLSLLGAPVLQAGELEKPTAFEMVGDLIIARPAGLLITAVGATAFVVSLPFSAVGGNVGESADQLVVGPARATFVRCLGCTNTGRRSDVKD